MLKAMGLELEFKSFEDPDLAEGRSMVIRVDVDYSPVWAVDLARLYSGFGIRATFFVQTDSPNYNLFSSENRKAVEDIHSLGQHVGLHHWEQAWEGEKALTAHVKERMGLLKGLFPFARPIVSWHNPIKELIERPTLLEDSGLLNVYGPRFFGKGRYYSDSNCRMSPSDFEEVISNFRKGLLICLFHPVIWVMGGGDMKEVMEKAFKNKIRELNDGFCLNAVWAAGAGARIMQDLEIAVIKR